jgi:hypothetical protein
MRFIGYKIIDQKQFHIHWRKGSDNIADYFTIHHAPLHHRRICGAKYLLDLHKPDFVSGEGVWITPAEDDQTLPGSHSPLVTIKTSNNSNELIHLFTSWLSYSSFFIQVTSSST